MRVALVHYWLVTMRGGEKVLEALCELFPQADIFTHVYAPEAISETIRRHNVQTSFIQKLPFSAHYYQKYLPLMPFALEQLDLRGYDLVISSESGPAKGVLVDSTVPHICYCHSPMRYLWDNYQQYLEECGPLTRFLWRPLAHKLRMWDTLSANRVDHFIANSHHVARRISRHYRRESTVIHPPVDFEAFANPAFAAQSDATSPQASGAPADRYYLFLGQLVGYKKANIAVEAFSRMGKKLMIAGEGAEMKKLTAMAGPTIHFAGRLDNSALRTAMHNCRALVFPGEEDFGIVPLEAMAAGRPVLAYGKGGALETVVDGVTGLFFPEQTASSLAEAVTQFEATEARFDPTTIVRHAQSFGKERFKEQFRTHLMSLGLPV